VLRIHLLEAQDLVAKDNMMGGMVKGKSDPYVKIHIGETTFKSHVIKENLNPTWNEMYEVGIRECSFEKCQDIIERFVFFSSFKLLSVNKNINKTLKGLNCYSFFIY